MIDYASAMTVGVTQSLPQAGLVSTASVTDSWGKVTAVATCMLLVVATVSAIIALRTQHADHARRRADATMRCLFRYLDESRRHWVVIRDAAKASTPAQTIKDLLRNTKATPARRAHQEILQELEMLASGSRLGIYSTRVVYDVAQSQIRQIWDLSRLYIEDLRTGSYDGRPAQPTAYERLEYLLSEFDRLEKKPKPKPKGTLPTV